MSLADIGRKKMYAKFQKHLICSWCYRTGTQGFDLVAPKTYRCTSRSSCKEREESLLDLPPTDNEETDTEIAKGGINE